MQIDSKKMLESLLYDSCHVNGETNKQKFTNNKTHELITKNQKEYGHRKRIKP
jgi:hypothetical protein